jgi:hypothetical protein
MLFRAALFLLALSATPALALDDCFSMSEGPWRGPVWNGTGIQVMETEFEAGTDGMLIGHYRIFDDVPFDGTLTGFRQTAPCEAEFTWNDRDGKGLVQIRFEPELGRFIGRWGAVHRAPALTFDGYRTRPKVIS